MSRWDPDDYLREMFGGRAKPAPTPEPDQRLARMLSIYEAALVELSCPGEIEAEAYARVARRALREASEVPRP